MADGRETTIFGDGEQSRDFVYVEDVVRALLAAAARGKGIFNVGTGESRRPSTACTSSAVGRRRGG